MFLVKNLLLWCIINEICNFKVLRVYILTNTSKENIPKNKIQALTKSMTIDIWLVKTFKKLQCSILRKKCPCLELFWSVFSRSQIECGKIRTRITPNTDTFHAVQIIIYLKYKVVGARIRSLWWVHFLLPILYVLTLLDSRQINTSTAKNIVISPDFLVWKFCGKAQFPHSFYTSTPEI